MAKKKRKLWWIYNQEEVVVAVCYTVTKGGAFSCFEAQSGLDREGYRAAPISFEGGCALAQ